MAMLTRKKLHLNSPATGCVPKEMAKQQRLPSVWPDALQEMMARLNWENIAIIIPQNILALP